MAFKPSLSPDNHPLPPFSFFPFIHCQTLFFLISDSHPCTKLSFLPFCLPAPPLILSLPPSLGYRKWFLSQARGLEGCTHCPKQRGHCVNPPKIQRRKEKLIKIRSRLSSAALTQTHIHTLHLRFTHKEFFSTFNTDTRSVLTLFTPLKGRSLFPIMRSRTLRRKRKE